MRRWLGWGEGLIGVMSPEFMGAVKGTCNVGASGYLEVVAGDIRARELRRLVEKLVPGS